MRHSDLVRGDRRKREQSRSRIGLTSGLILAHIVLSLAAIATVFGSQLAYGTCEYSAHHGTCGYAVTPITLGAIVAGAVISVVAGAVAAAARIMHGKSGWWTPLVGMGALLTMTVVCLAAVHLAYG